jgi:hypothetical protein
MSEPAARKTLVLLLALLTAAVALYPFLGDPSREFPLAVVALIGALCVHALSQSRSGR